MTIDASRFELKTDDEEDRLQSLVGPKGAWKTSRDLQLGLLAELGLARQTRFLDLGCGALRVGLPLIDYLEPGHYVGVDVDPACIEAAHALVARFDLAPRRPTVVRSTSFGRDELSPPFDRIWCFQVFIHLTRDLVFDALGAIEALLADDGTAWVSLKVNEAAEEFETFGQWRGNYVLNRAPLSFYEAAARDRGLALEVLDHCQPAGWATARKRHGDGLKMVALTKSSSG